VAGLGEVLWMSGCCTVTLRGEMSFALRRAEDVPIERKIVWGDRVKEDRLRWFEVYMYENDLRVVTRSTDEVTTAVADGFAVLCAKFWEASCE